MLKFGNKHWSVLLAILCALSLLAALVSCTQTETPATTDAPQTSGEPATVSVTSGEAQTTGTPDVTPSDATPTDPATGTGEQSGTGEPVEIFPIVFSETSVDVGASGVKAEGAVLTIDKPGSYEISGSTSNGRIIVAVEKTDLVDLILNNVSITNPTGPAIFCDSADKLYITAKAGTVNTVSDGKSYADKSDGAPNAAIYSDDDLTIRGEGTLNVLGKFKNGISSKNDIKIKGLTLNVTSYNTGVRGKGSVTVTSGVIVIDAGNDGIKSTEETKKDKGFVEVSGGTLTIIAGDDGIQAATTLTLSGGVVKITAEGKQLNEKKNKRE